MSNLSAFLHPDVPERQEIVISSRFKDEEGNVVPFVIRPLTAEENNLLVKKYSPSVRDKNGNEKKKFNPTEYQKAFIVAGTVEPDFTSKEICDAYGVLDPMEVPGKMLLAGEYMKLSDAIMKLSGLDDEEAETEAKN